MALSRSFFFPLIFLDLSGDGFRCTIRYDTIQRGAVRFYILHSTFYILQDIILGRFEGGSEETKTAAAYSLGHVAVGNMTL